MKHYEYLTASELTQTVLPTVLREATDRIASILLLS